MVLGARTQSSPTLSSDLATREGGAWVRDKAESGKEREGETERGRDRERQNQREGETERGRDRESERQRLRETERVRDRESGIHSSPCIRTRQTEILRNGNRNSERLM